MSNGNEGQRINPVALANAMASAEITAEKNGLVKAVIKQFDPNTGEPLPDQIVQMEDTTLMRQMTSINREKAELKQRWDQLKETEEKLKALNVKVQEAIAARTPESLDS